jgi:hypothetical protein
MKTFGIVMIAIGILAMAAPAISTLWKKDVPGVLTVMVVKDKEGESMSLYPLLGIVSFATGAAMVVAAVVTKKR